MRVDMTRHGMAAAAAVAVLAVAGCTQSAPTENAANGSAAVIFIIDSKTACESKIFSLDAQEAGADGMKSANPDVLG